MATSVSVIGSSKIGCDQCGTIRKSGRRSCCARGGAWFKNCGDAGDTQFDHTWAEGVESCNRFVSSISSKAPFQYMFGHVAFGAYLTNNTHIRNMTNEQANTKRSLDVPDVSSTNAADRVEFAQLAVCMCIFLYRSE